MSNIVGSLIVKLTAQTGDFLTGMKKASTQGSSEIKKFAQDVGNMAGGPFAKLTSFLTSPKTLALGGVTFLAEEVMRLGHEFAETERQAKKLSMTTTDFLLLQQAAKKGGVDTGFVENSMRKMMESIVNPANTDVFSRLNLDTAALSQAGAGKALEVIAKRLAEIKNPMERLRAETELFGRGGAELDLILQNLARGGLKQYEDKIISLQARMGLRLVNTDWIAALNKAWQEFIGNVAYGFSLIGGIMSEIWEDIRTKGFFGQWRSIDEIYDTVSRNLQAAAREDVPALGDALSEAAEQFSDSLKKGMDDSLTEWKKNLDEASQMNLKFDPLMAYEAAINRIRELRNLISPDVMAAALADARKTALDKLVKETPAMKPLEGPEKYSAEAYRAIVEIQTGREEKQVEELRQANATLNRIDANTARTMAVELKVAPLP